MPHPTTSASPERSCGHDERQSPVPGAHPSSTTSVRCACPAHPPAVPQGPLAPRRFCARGHTACVGVHPTKWDGKCGFGSRLLLVKGWGAGHCATGRNPFCTLLPPNGTQLPRERRSHSTWRWAAPQWPLALGQGSAPPLIFRSFRISVLESEYSRPGRFVPLKKPAPSAFGSTAVRDFW